MIVSDSHRSLLQRLDDLDDEQLVAVLAFVDMLLAVTPPLSPPPAPAVVKN